MKKSGIGTQLPSDNLYIGVKSLSDLDYLIECFESGEKITDKDEDGYFVIQMIDDEYHNALMLDPSMFMIIGGTSIVYKHKLLIEVRY